jgi:hypothetical protein
MTRRRKRKPTRKPDEGPMMQCLACGGMKFTFTYKDGRRYAGSCKRCHGSGLVPVIDQTQVSRQLAAGE